MSEPKVNRATVIEWLDANEIEVTHTQLAGLFASAIEAAPAQPVAELVTTAHGFETTLSLLPGHFDLPYGTHLLYAAPQPAAQDAPVDAAVKPAINVGTIGHVGSGRTTLTAALGKLIAAQKGNHD